MFVIRPGNAGDLPAMAEILNDEILHSYVIYTETPKSAADMELWFVAVEANYYPFLVTVDESSQKLAGFAYADAFRKLPSYRTTAEVSLYVAKAWRGCGLGKALLTALIEAARRADLHALVSVIDSENQASLLLHARLGFTKRGDWPEIARKFNSWREASFWQLLLGPAKVDPGEQHVVPTTGHAVAD